MAGQARWLAVGRAYSRTGWTPTGPFGLSSRSPPWRLHLGSWFSRRATIRRRITRSFVPSPTVGRPSTRFEPNRSLRTIDVTEHGGHLYAAKAPGLAMFSLPAYVVLEKLGVDTDGGYDKHSLGASPLGGGDSSPRALATRSGLETTRAGARYCSGCDPRCGDARPAVRNAVLFTSARGLLAFGAFAVLWSSGRALQPHARGDRGLARGSRRDCGVFGRDFRAVLGAMRWCGCRRLRRAAAFVLGFVVGIAPTLLFNWWAFSSPSNAV